MQLYISGKLFVMVIHICTQMIICAPFGLVIALVTSPVQVLTVDSLY